MPDFSRISFTSCIVGAYTVRGTEPSNYSLNPTISTGTGLAFHKVALGGFNLVTPRRHSPAG